MKMEYLCNILTLSIILALILKDVAAVCNNVTTWDPIPEDQYDRDYSSINMANARPLGFKVGRYIYNDQESICVKVENTEGRKVEVKFETEPASVLCVRSTTGVENEQFCIADKQGKMCEDFQAGGDGSTIFEFFCNGQCAEADVTFWYRFTVCPYTNSNDCEMWCFNRDDEYPGGLFTVPFMTTEPPAPPISAGSKLGTMLYFHIAALTSLKYNLV